MRYYKKVASGPCHRLKFLLIKDVLFEITEQLVWIITLLLFGLGLAGTLVPMIPGIIIIAVGCIWQGAMGNHEVSWWGWAVLALLSVGGLLVDKICGGMGAKKFGGTAAGIWGAIIGVVVGGVLCTPLIGFLVMPFLGALVGECIFAGKDFLSAFKAGAGAAVGMFVGLLMEFLCGVIMIAWFFFCYFLF